MKYSSIIMVEGDSENLLKLFEPESKKFKNERAAYTVTKKGDKLEFKISAKDATALRAIMNSISKTLMVYEKVKI